MNGYFDYDETEYDFTPLDAEVKPAASECDRCRFLPGEAIAVGPLFAVCACWIGQGAPAEECECGPEGGEVAGGQAPD
ncbi:hypothetical protein ADK70_25825 [Streptomyces rimosus subsp. pseudoverticillatus]|uniref:hypothetical protein n=1 Tax=Streptomyces rimosus TaxID=1927 RepID=UPI0006B29CA0|nr:hypothetical protein [Streptomyces rimosus]KOT81551.1 hypothetical protein ADK70_25825 [Streptomyces rimosus subsp. pseudoverticillatus]